MEVLRNALNYALDPSNDFWGKVGTHLQLCAVALLLASLVGIPLGIWISRYEGLARVIVNVVGIMRIVPSIAVLFLLLPSQGLGFRPAAIALTLLAIPPLLINTNTGMRGVNPATVEAGRGLGMSAWQLLRKVQVPLALPVMLAGMRIAAIEVIASAALATLIGGGGLGYYIAAGLSLSRNEILLVGAIPVAVIALVTELFLAYAQRRATLRQG